MVNFLENNFKYGPSWPPPARGSDSGKELSGGELHAAFGHHHHHHCHCHWWERPCCLLRLLFDTRLFLLCLQSPYHERSMERYQLRWKCGIFRHFPLFSKPSQLIQNICISISNAFDGLQKPEIDVNMELQYSMIV